MITAYDSSFARLVDEAGIPRIARDRGRRRQRGGSGRAARA
jgi:hypothetical protein